MNCPDSESLIAFAMNPLATENDEIAEHIHGCPECRMNLRLVNESLLADEWCSKADVSGESVQRQGVQKYIHVLDRDLKDRNGRWLHKGDEVLVDPEDPTCIVRATEEAKKIFEANGYGFWRNLPAQTANRIKAVGSEINRFGSAIAENMRHMIGRTIPAKNLPWWVNFVPYPLTVVFRKQREITGSANRNDLSVWMSEHGFIPKLETLSVLARKSLEEANFFRVWELTCGSICFRVFGVYVTPIAISDLTCRKGDISLYNGIKQFIHEWEERNCPKANCKCYILGSSCGWESFSTVDLPDAVEIMCSPSESGESWIVDHRDLSSYRRVFRTFVYALYPETVEQRRSRVVKTLSSKVVPGSQTSEKLSNVCGIPEELVEEVFDDLQRDPQSGWANYITEEGKKATRIKNSGGKGSLVFHKRRLPVIQISLFLVLLGLIAVTVLVHQKLSEIGMVAGSVILAVASCAKGYVERKLT